ncbi:MAG: hypothetical protein M3Z92_15920 [Bacteroidota bacterium]|nr:hypothetical protein [Bacteroidota bacterium]MDQ6889952.1 hypothetical protein [Bacteroidota bacterium]
MLQNKLPKGSLLFAGLAAFAYYKYSQLSPGEKSNLIDNIKAKSKSFYDQCVPGELKNLFSKKEIPGNNSQYGEGGEFVA